MHSTETLLEYANARLQGTLAQLDLDDQNRQCLSCGFRIEEKVYVGYLTWKRVKYAGKVSYHFRLAVSSLHPEETVTMLVRKVEPGGLGRSRGIKLPKLVLEVEREFRQEVE